jgi:hypothetical protein
MILFNFQSQGVIVNTKQLYQFKSYVKKVYGVVVDESNLKAALLVFEKKAQNRLKVFRMVSHYLGFLNNLEKIGWSVSDVVTILKLAMDQGLTPSDVSDKLRDVSKPKTEEDNLKELLDDGWDAE